MDRKWYNTKRDQYVNKQCLVINTYQQLSFRKCNFMSKFVLKLAETI